MKKILKYVFDQKKYIIIASIGMIGGIIAELILPYLNKIVIDNIIINKQIDLLFITLTGIFFITIFRALMGYVQEFTFDYVGSRISKALKFDLFKHIQKQPFKYFDKTNTGELMSRIGEDVDNIWMAFGFGIGLSVEFSLYFILGSVVLFYLNWKLALISLISAPFIAYLATKLEKEIGKAFDKISDQAAVINTTAQENISGVRLVKAFAREKYEILKFLKLNDENYNLNIMKSKIWGKYFPTIEFLGNAALILVVTVGGMFVINEKISLGTLVAFNGYMWMIVWPMRLIGWLSNILSQANASAKKIEKIFNEIEEDFKGIELDRIHGSIEFKNVSFKYENEYVLKNINFKIDAGKTLAIMGPTGSGKSTLISLISRFYPIDEGEILIDGINVNDISLNSLRKNISIIFQDTFLFSESVKENIKYGKENATDKEIINVCKEAQAHDFIMKLPEKYDTLIGERGLGLSGGQKQRLTIARGLLKNAPIIIFDDATSALDMDTEYELLESIYSKEKQNTKIIIAHRISAVKNADEIIFLENGEIVERGNHYELLERKGKYFDIFKEQFKDFEDLVRDEVI
ncbi:MULTISPECIES: ABC transporter ATP-binding protein [unclassified Marinitoga]|uniref:ABC transporter ATP-binding protein n=1 Tax=unclassified Marinitoga TaxID=2640159 RepID=UPI0006414B04|nr:MULTISPECIES: ABC transporter ATP-binding protein [unclassified Marinitoga]KLO22464.1 ABC transporter [Marinitoga sp. 1155]NUV00256.1 ABC transporter [Marinitoga sp. 1154]